MSTSVVDEVTNEYLLSKIFLNLYFSKVLCCVKALHKQLDEEQK